jgi:hypothetical protein
LAIHFEISQCQYNNMILANGKVAIRDPMHRLADGNVGIKLLSIDLQVMLANAKNGTQR